MAKPTEPLVEQRLKSCPFCGVGIKRIESWAKAFQPNRLFHEYHHIPESECFMRKSVVWSGEAGGDDEAQFVAAWNARFDNDRTAMLVEALAPFSHAADLADGAMLGRYGKAELPDDTTVLGALKLTLGDIRRARDAVRVQESHGGERYPDIQRLQLGKQED